MNFLKSSLFSSFMIFGVFAYAEVKDLNVVIAKGTPVEAKDLGKLLGQILLVPAKIQRSNQSVFKVTKVEKGSVFEREGIRVGDLVFR